MIVYKELGSGVRLVYEKDESAKAASIGVWVGAGSVCESEKLEGISHYIEHMFFKGTKTRSAKKLATDIDDLGASVNAFTGKEATCYHIKALTEVFPQAVDLLMDMMINSMFDSAEMDKERGVILEEMAMVEDTPDDYAIDILMENVFAGTPLASQVIGTRQSVGAICRDDIISYIDTHYKKDNIVVSVAGNFDENRLIEQLNEYLSVFGSKAPQKGNYGLSAPRKFSTVQKDIGQSHLALGIPGVSLLDEDYYAQSVVNEILGGSMSSRLFQNIREQRGLAYSVFSAPLSYSKAGMFFIYAGLTPGKEKEAIDAIAFELSDLAEKGICEEQLKVVKQRLKSGYIFACESLNSRMQRLGKNRLLLGRNWTDDQVMADIDAVTLKQVNDFAVRIGDINKYSAVCISSNEIDLQPLFGA